MPAHIVRLLLVLATVAVLAVIGRNYVLDPSYYQFGAYRGDAVIEIAAGAPQFRGAAYCETCHAVRHTEWTAGVHRKVKCEVCHGPAREHPADGPLPIPDDTMKLCTICHEAMPGRPAAQPQIVIAEHPVPHDGVLQCLTCHNPHSPKIGGREEPAEAQAPATPAAAEIAAPAPAAVTLIPAPRLVELTTPCTPCHGADGLSSVMSPALAGSERAVLVRKLQEYRSGALQHPVMNAVTKSLSDEDIADLAEHYASLPGDTTQ
jgi:predicted CXXCH cytochrome family protein